MIISCIAISIAAAWFCSRFSLNRRKKLLILLSVFFTGSEIGKQLLLYIRNDCHYIWWYFPFQLCSMHLYLLPVLTAHSYLWHFLMIFTGVLLGLSPEFSGSFLPSCAVFLSCAGIASVFNLIFHPYGSINMFYISPLEPVTQAVFRDIAEKIGDGLCHVLYLTVIMVGAGIIHLIFKRLLSVPVQQQR